MKDENDFWEKYVNADLLERENILKKMVKFPIWQGLLNMNKVKAKKVDGLTLQEFCLKTHLMSYFDDLIQYLQSKKSKLTEKDIKQFSNKIKSLATKKYINQKPHI